MNGKTAKAIRRLATLKGLPYHAAKELWKRTPKPVRAVYRRQILKDIHDFAFNLKRWRGHRTQKEAAFALCVSFDTYRNWEYRVNTPDPIKVVELQRRMDENSDGKSNP